MPLLQLFTEALMVSAACSTDSLVTGFAYGANKIKISLAAALVINLICCVTLGLSLFLGSVIGQYIPHTVTLAVCVTILCVIGVSKIFSSVIKNIIKKKNGINKDIKFSLFSLKFILNISAEPEAADADGSKTLSLKEAIPLAIALSLDGLAIGLGAGLTSASTLAYLVIIGFALALGFIALPLGCLIGRKITSRASINLGWLSGLILIGLAVMKIFV